MTRLQKLLAAIPAPIDALLITNNKNQKYLTGFEFHDGLLLVTRKTSYLITDFRYIEAAKKEASHEFEIITHNGSLPKQVADILDAKATIGYEDASITVEFLNQYKEALPEATFVGAGRIVENLRIKKEELGNIL